MGPFYVLRKNRMGLSASLGKVCVTSIFSRVMPPSLLGHKFSGFFQPVAGQPVFQTFRDYRYICLLGNIYKPALKLLFHLQEWLSFRGNLIQISIRWTFETPHVTCLDEQNNSCSWLKELTSLRVRSVFFCSGTVDTDVKLMQLMLTFFWNPVGRLIGRGTVATSSLAFEGMGCIKPKWFVGFQPAVGDEVTC